ncbi:hypothetical protein B0T25DRAFT_262837 [Lasiosphaeria hispida]|uniref:Uncharacterized protein n=1 Tax=Lasiosphaeria hispida TaxID=260671 RepID=A0AAJ0HGP4_9PEZI|nr:hypothetical protein B0T25DRAFT_262837 [Lasiosphaeria hispida]
MYTCRLVAIEMRGLPFQLNTITFRTLYSEELRTRACRWAEFYSLAQHEVIGGTAHDVAVHMKDDLFDKTLQHFGDCRFSHLLWFSRNHPGLYPYPRPDVWEPWHSRGEIPSVYRDAGHEFIQIALADPDMHDYLSSERIFDTCRHSQKHKVVRSGDSGADIFALVVLGMDTKPEETAYARRATRKIPSSSAKSLEIYQQRRN